MANPPSWQCPYCGHHQHSSAENCIHIDYNADIGEAIPHITAVNLRARRCLNAECNRLNLGVAMVVKVPDTRKAAQLSGAVSIKSRVDSPSIPGAVPTKTAIYKDWQLLPESEAKPQPGYIPEPLRQDYLEACLIRDLSPKASSTLARRCLQGMIRDFCGISKKTLYAEIAELKKQIDEDRAPKGVLHETMEAIDAVKDVGNIGAHMEADINLIVDVDKGEAQALIGLIEMLFQDWYVARHDRQHRLDNLKDVAAGKKQAKKAPIAKEEDDEVVTDPLLAPSHEQE